MYGGQVTLNGNEYALSAGINDSNRGNVTIKGGKAHFTGNSCVLNVNNLTLGWTNGDDEYYASKWDGKVIIESGKHFWNKDTETEITSDFNGKTLVPAGSYPVNIANAVNGTVETDKTRVLSGHTVTITATPAEGYGIESVSVKDADNVTVAVTNTAIGKYTFTMPDRNVTVSGAFVQMTNDFGNAVITGINDDYIYTSKVIDIGTPVVTLMGNELTKGSDYDISYTLNGASVSQVSAVGDYTLTVTPHTGSPYTGSKSKVFRVLDFTSATLSGVKDVYQYTNSNRTIEGDITVTLTGLTMNETLVPGEDYTVTYKRDGYTFDAMNLPGNYTLTVKGKGRCSACGTLTANFIVLTFEEYDADSGRLITSTTPDDNASVVTSTTTGMGNGWYVATGNVTVSDRIWVSGDAHLVLCDGATLTASRGFEVPSGCSLTIYSQSGNTGRLMAYTSDMYGSAIGHSGVWNDAGTITIHGGEINATSRGDASKTIGGQKSTVTIYGGQVSASYDLNGAGIGGIDATVNLGWCRTSDYIYAKSYYATVNLLNNFVFDDNRQQLVTTANLNSNRRIVPQSAGWFVMFNSQGGTAVAQQTVDNNGTATEPTAPSRTGYTFGGWYTDSQCSDGTAYNFSTAVTQNITLYAKWTLTPFTITTPESFEVTVDGSAATTATIGQTVTLTIKSGYTLTGSITVTDANSQTVALTDKGNDTYEFTMPPSNVNVVAFAGMLEPGWTLVGTYKTQNFTAADTKYYGFVGTANTGTDVGTFVQVGGYVRIKPLRSYLVAPGGTPKTAPAHRSGDSETIPTTLRIRLLGTNGVTTGILQVYGSGFSLRECGVANTVQGADAWYTLDGRKLSGEPTQKGLYINNGKKVIIK